MIGSQNLAVTTTFGHEQGSCTPIGAGPSVDTGLGTQEQPDGNVNVMPLVTTRPSSSDASPADEAASGSSEQATSSRAAQLEMASAGGELSTTPVKHAPKQRAKPVYKATPHAHKLATTSPKKGSNSFAILGSSDNEVESLIRKAKQTRKMIHPRLLGTGHSDTDSCELQEFGHPPDPTC